MSRMWIGCSTRGSASPRLRIPVPASRISVLPSRQRQLDARRVAAVAHRLRSRRGNRPARTPDLELHRVSSSCSSPPTARRSRSHRWSRPRRRSGSRWRRRPGGRRRRDGCGRCRGTGDSARSAIVERDLVVGQRLLVVAERAELGRPLCRGHRRRSPRSAARASPRRPRCRTAAPLRRRRERRAWRCSTAGSAPGSARAASGAVHGGNSSACAGGAGGARSSCRSLS